MIFIGFWKKSIFWSKSIGVSLWFYRNRQFGGKNWPKLCISWPWQPYMSVYGFWRKTDQSSVFLGCGPPYSLSVIDNGPVYEFLWVMKNWNILSKYIGVSLWLYRNRQFWGQKLLKLRISWPWSKYSGLVIHSGPVHEFFLSFEKLIFFSKSMDVILQFYWKSPVWG
jgi:hypothetical protein